MWRDEPSVGRGMKARSRFSMERSISARDYALAAPFLMLIPHIITLIVFGISGQRPQLNFLFWVFPLGTLSGLEIPYWLLIGACALGLAANWFLVVLSMRRARRSGIGYLFVPGIIFPYLQLIAVAILACLPKSHEALGTQEEGASVQAVMEGLFAGMAVMVFAVLFSAVTFGAYGWGLFVVTPLIVGTTTGYLANRKALLGGSETTRLVLAAAALGSFALIMFALEGLVCLILAAPLGAPVAILGGWIGRSLAKANHRGRSTLYSVAMLPVVFAADAASPPAALILSEESVEIAAPPSEVWRAATSTDRVLVPPNLVGSAGLAYPIASELRGSGRGAMRLGHFSTGIARERVTEWTPGKRLKFEVVNMPPAMEEMSPYRRVHAPHLEGYFETGETRFDLTALPNGRTRLTVSAAHRLRIDPLPYWEPIARWAIQENSRRVLEDIRIKAENSAVDATGGSA